MERCTSQGPGDTLKSWMKVSSEPLSLCKMNHLGVIAQEDAMAV